MENLQIVDAQADEEFRRLVREVFPKSYQWEERYVDHEMQHIRWMLHPDLCGVDGREVLELGCNIGATAIVSAFSGARVTGVDLNPDYLEVAALNAKRYGLAERIHFQQVTEGTPLPFPPESFDVIICNSVLEYVKHPGLPKLQSNLDQLLKPGGLLLVFGTSNRIWPMEVHSGQWFTNYLPHTLDPWLNRPARRGVWPWQARWGFGRYDDVIAGRGADAYLQIKQAMGLKGKKLAVFQSICRVCAILRISPGLLTSSMTVLLQKPIARGQNH